MFIKKAGLLSLAAALFLAVITYGQGAQQNADRIRQLRDEIAKRETVDAPADLVELNRSKLIERRAELRTLLKVEIANLRKHRNTMGSTLTREESQKIDESIQSYSEEIARLANAIQDDLTADGATQTVARAGAAPSPTITLLPSPAATPVPTSSPTPTPTPDIAAATADNNKKTDAYLNCDDVLQLKQAGATPQPSPPAKTSFSEIDKVICRMAKDIPARAKQFRQFGGKNHLIISYHLFPLIEVLMAKKDTPTFLVEAEETRLDKEVGAANASAAGTSLVSKGGAPRILSFAVENGALTKDVNGSAITFHGNPVGIINALKDKGLVSAIKEQQNDPLISFLKKTSFGFTFNTDRGSVPGVFTATKQQLSAVSARIEIINRRRPEIYIKDWEDFLHNHAQTVANLFNQDNNQSIFVDRTDPNTDRVFPYGLFKDPALQTWYKETQQQLESATTDAEVSTVLQDRLAKLPVKELQPQTVLALTGLEKQIGAYVNGRDELLKKINSGTVVTFEYLNKREVTAPDTSHFTFIAEKGTGGGKLDFTFNGSLTMFNNFDALKTFVKANPTLPPARRLRDFNFAGQMDLPIGNLRGYGQFVLFANGRYERLLENATTDLGTILPGTKGDVASFQFGLKVPIKGTGFKIPVSMTVANRTELIKEKEVRGNIGFTLDLDTFFAKFKPF